MSGANLRGVPALSATGNDAKSKSPARGGGGGGEGLLSGFSGLLPLALLDDSEERPFPCPFCEARFKKKQHLQNHERIHTGEKYMCPICCQGFSRRHILKHHIYRKHLQATGSAGGYGGTTGGGGSSSSTGSKSVPTTPTTPTTPSTPVSPTSLSLLPLLQSSLQQPPVVPPPPPPRSNSNDVTPKKSKTSETNTAVDANQSPSCGSSTNSFLSNSNSFLTDPLPESVISSLLSSASLAEHPF